MPDDATNPRRADNTLVKSLGRAFRWKRVLDSGDFATIAELAEREDIAPSYMTRVLCLTPLAPDFVEAILNGRQGPEVTLAQVLEAVPLEWAGQAAHFGRVGRSGRRREALQWYASSPMPTYLHEEILEARHRFVVARWRSWQLICPGQIQALKASIADRKNPASPIIAAPE